MTGKLCIIDRSLLNIAPLQLPRKSLLMKSKILVPVKHSQPVQRGENTTLAPKLKCLNLKKVDSGGADSFKILNSNVFGYTPYDTGAVKSDFTNMFNSMKKTQSIINPKKIIKRMSSSDSSNMMRNDSKKSEESPNIEVLKKKSKKTEKRILGRYQSQLCKINLE